jgi:gamma-glutamyl:cysteine ligase YbdK (ATP-grasp superfamily)
MRNRGRRKHYSTLEVLGPEHEFSLVDDRLQAKSVVDQAIKALGNRVANNVSVDGWSFGKELQTHVAELKANEPFRSPKRFEDTMYSAAVRVGDFLRKEFNVSLLGTGMHPFLLLEETGIWRHRDRRIFDALSQVFNLRQHGWLNIQSYQLNLPYADEEDGIWLHNAIVNLVPYLPAVASSSPIIESKVGRFLDNRLYFYGASQREIPSITGDVVPEYVASFEEYWRRVISTYSSDLMVAGAPAVLLNREWINSRGAIFRFDRRAIEIRVMDEQECIKMDVALSCFIRSLLRGWLRDGLVHQSRDILISDYRAIIRDGLSAQVKHPRGKTARDVLLDFLTIARGSSTPDEREYLSLIERRVIQGSLSHMILRDTVKSAGERSFRDSVLEVYLTLIKCLRDNRPYF